MESFLKKVGVIYPIIQAPMAGTSTPELAAIISNAGGLGSLALGSFGPDAARKAIAHLKSLTSKPFNLNLFCNKTPVVDLKRQADWIKRLEPQFQRFGAQTPSQLKAPYTSFLDDPEMQSVVLEANPRVVSFHFGLPSKEYIKALHNAGAVLLCTVTNVDEALIAVENNIDILVAQGYEAGGHRGTFEENLDSDPLLSTAALVRLLTVELPLKTGKLLPIVAAGGIMDGRGIRTVLDLGACAVQIGTAFVATDESAANAAYRAALTSPAGYHTVVTSAISGRPARSLQTEFTNYTQDIPRKEIPDYPLTYFAGKALNKAASDKSNYQFGALWAGQGAPLCRSMPAEKLLHTLVAEAKL